jgi:hypothetical protein
MSTPLLLEEEMDQWVEPDLSTKSQAIQTEYFNRKKALQGIARGKSISAAADANDVDRATLTKTAGDCLAIAPDGKPWGWRACIPHRVRNASAKKPVAVPEGPGPGAFTQLRRALPELEDLLAGFTKPLPTRERRSTAFERFLEKFLAVVRKQTQGIGYPFNAGDKGRRSVLEHLKRLRRELPVSAIEEEEQTELMQAKQLKEVFDFGVMERLEFDAHRMDADFYVEVDDASGKTALREISYIWLLLIIDSVSRLVLGWSLVIGRAYSQIDVLRVFSRSLTPWEPRDLLAPGMKYVPGSGIGTVPATGRLQRGLLTAADNALAHHAKLTTTNLIRHIRGVMSLGPAHVPETRGILEALFRMLENGAIRHLPGGFEPVRDRDTPKRPTNGESAQKYPLNPVALNDLLDVVIAGYNATPLASLGDQSPIEVVRRHGTGGGWGFEASKTETDAGNLTNIRLSVRIKGSQKKNRQPFVNYMRARYRAFGLRDRWDLIGERQFEAVLSVEDLRYITLLDEHGDVFVRLTALPPWSRTRHDFDLRKLIIRWSNRKLFSIVGVDDAVDAYRRFVRSNAAQLPAAADQVGKYWQHHAKPNPADKPPPAPAFVPRSGSVSFDHIKDPTK